MSNPSGAKAWQVRSEKPASKHHSRQWRKTGVADIGADETRRVSVPPALSIETFGKSAAATR